jgi:hypothetical protein
MSEITPRDEKEDLQDADAVLGLQEKTSEEEDVQAHVQKLSSLSVNC